MDIKALAEKYDSYIIERRRYYHAHPELSFQEWETTKSLIEDVKALGYEVQSFEDYPGLVATLDTGRPGRTIMLRADIDALPVHEKTGFEFASQNEGVMHACGHDNHMAMLLGAAKILAEVKDEIKGGKVKLILQSGEEFGYGAKYYIEHGMLCRTTAAATAAPQLLMKIPFFTAAPANTSMYEPPPLPQPIRQLLSTAVTLYIS